MEHTGGVGDDVKTARPSVTLPTRLKTFQDIHSVTLQGRGAVRKLFSRVTHSMVGRGETLLARPSANSKRKWDQGGLASKRHCGN